VLLAFATGYRSSRPHMHSRMLFSKHSTSFRISYQTLPSLISYSASKPTSVTLILQTQISSPAEGDTLAYWLPLLASSSAFFGTPTMFGTVTELRWRKACKGVHVSIRPFHELIIEDER